MVDKPLVNLVIRLGTGAVSDKYETYRVAANQLGFPISRQGGQQMFGLSRALRFNINESLVVLGEQFRGLGVDGTIPWHAGIYPWELLVSQAKPNNPGFLPMRLFQLKNGATSNQREAFDAIREQFEHLAPGRSFDVTFTAAKAPVAATAPISAGQVAVVGGDNDPGNDGHPGSIIAVVCWNKTDPDAPRRERPIQLFGAGTWEALVLAEALVNSTGRLTVLDEPGASLHPIWQSVLRQTLREAPGQVLLVTHSPHILPLNANQKGVKVVRFELNERLATHPWVVDPDVLAKLSKKLVAKGNGGLLFAWRVVFCEGETDVEAVRVIAQQLDLDLDTLNIAVIDCGSRENMPDYIALAAALGLRYLAIMDGDATKAAKDDVVKRNAQAVRYAVENDPRGTLVEFPEDLETTLGVFKKTRSAVLDALQAFDLDGACPAEITELRACLCELTKKVSAP